MRARGAVHSGLMGADQANCLISVVTPVFRCTASLPELYSRLRSVLDTENLPYEIVFVDDASPDNSSSVLAELTCNDPSVATVALERNVGQQRAVLAGLAQAHGTWIVVMDADLQDPPEAIPTLLSKLQEGFGAVFAGRRGNYESRSRLLTSRAYKWLLHLLCGTPVDAGLYVAMNQTMVNRLLEFEAPCPSVVAMIGCTGLPLASIPIPRAERRDGRSAYTSWKRIKMGFLTIAWVLSRVGRPKVGLRI
jgi:polyisoprenyl-phosphate glycosyltransferase